MISFEKVTKVYPGGLVAVKDLSLEVAEGETLVLLGTSGSGKTTTMKMVNRLIEPTSGRITLDGLDIMRQDPIRLRRQIGYAIQHIGLFPHMTVGENIGIVPHLLGWPPDKIKERCNRMLTMVGLEPAQFAHRHPAQLSGGQKQRVGVARALAADPPVVLMDEPFGALDPITREELQKEFLELLASLKKTVLFVTHDIFEAVTIGTRIALLDNGKLQQAAAPAEMVQKPANTFVKQFLGKHRFQLFLITRSIQDLITTNRSGLTAGDRSQKPEKKPALFIKPTASIADALDLFQATGRQTLPVYEKNRLVARLKKEELIHFATAASTPEKGAA